MRWLDLYGLLDNNCQGYTLTWHPDVDVSGESSFGRVYCLNVNISFTSLWNDLVSDGHGKTTAIICNFLCELFNRLNLSLWIFKGMKQDAMFASTRTLFPLKQEDE